MKHKALLIAGVTTLVVSAAGVSQAGASAAPTDTALRQGGVIKAGADDGAPVLKLTMDGGPLGVGELVSELTSSGPAPVNVDVVTSNGGRAVRDYGRYGTWGLRLPDFSASGASPRAVVRVVETGDGDLLEPEEGDFRFGAAWMLNTASRGSAADDGDNLVQRGLFGDEGQYKLQIDDRVPMCSVQGDEGVVVARSARIEPNVWYRTRCVRRGDSVSIRVWRLTDFGPETSESSSQHGPIGSVEFDDETPLSVGGKLTKGGALSGGSGDQFNGVVDNVVYDTAD